MPLIKSDAGNLRFRRRNSNLCQTVAVVTGAASGIGKAITERLLLEDVSVFAVDKNGEALQAIQRQYKPKGSTRLECFVSDLRDYKQIEEAFVHLEGIFGRLDILINCAGLFLPGLALEGKHCDMEEMLQVNVLAAAQCSREAVIIMRKCGLDSGHIVNISSGLAYEKPIGELRFYAATKHALRALTDNLRDELREAKSGIRVTAISPGPVNTPAFGRLMANADMVADMINKCAVLEPVDVADAVIYALSAPPYVEIGEIRLKAIGLAKPTMMDDGQTHLQ